MKSTENQKSPEKLKENEHVISEKTVGNYMREMHIKAHYIKPWTRTTISKDFIKKIKKHLKKGVSIHHHQTQHGAQTLPIYEHMMTVLFI